MPKRHLVKEHEYHLIDRVTGESHGGFETLEGARAEARWLRLAAYDIFHGDRAVERHDPGAGLGRET